MSRLPFRLEASDGYRWEALARYNAEVARGLVHTPEWDWAMAVDQAAFDDEQAAKARAAGGVPMPGGGWLVPPPRPRSRWGQRRWRRRWDGLGDDVAEVWRKAAEEGR